MTLTPAQERTLRNVVHAFLRENAVTNLSALRTEDACWNGNILDSLPLLDVLADRPVTSLLDVGTGGGFPLLPAAVCLPETRCVGVDSVGKKVDAVRRIAASAGLKNVEVIAGRTEELGQNPAYREQFDVVTARAVAELPVLLEYCSPFTKPGGRVILWKSLQIEEELKASLLARAELSCHLIAQHEYELPGDWGRRQLLVFEKTAPLSDKYPREVGVPKKHPLL